MVLPARFELATRGFRDPCSTAELRQHWYFQLRGNFRVPPRMVAEPGRGDGVDYYLRAPFRALVQDRQDSLAHLVEMLPLDLEAGGFDTTEHSCIAVNLTQARQQKRDRLLAVGELSDSIGLEQVNVHIHADQLRDLQSLFRAVGAFEPPLLGNLSMTRKVLFAVFIDSSTQGLTAIVVDLVSLERIEIEQETRDDRIVDPIGESPIVCQLLSVDQVIVQVTEPFVNA